MMELPEAFLTRMKDMLGGEYPAFLQSYADAPLRALRVNTLKLSPETLLSLSPWALAPLPDMEDGFLLAQDAPGIGSHPYHLAGLFYMQEPSAMLPAAALAPKEGMRVLDLCAAPGGKASALSARIGETGLLVANEIVPNRAKVLLQNLQRMGAGNAVVTNARPEAICAAFPSFFDAVLVDAPCSGEGMFRKDETAVREWSPAHVLACARRQEGILECAAQTLRAGGRLAYATCTFSEEENERIVEGFLQAHPDFSHIRSARIYPHSERGEGQFYALLRREGEALSAPLQKDAPARRHKPSKELEAATEALCELFPSFPVERLRALPDGRVLLMPKNAAPLPEGLRILAAGVEAGELQKGRFVPSHALFQYCGENCVRRIELSLDDPALCAFLRGETIEAAGVSGYAAVCVNGFALGFGKASQGVLKNHFPKGLRLRG